MKKIIWLLLVANLIAAFFYVTLRTGHQNTTRDLPALAITPNFSLVRESGASFGQKDLQGGPWVGSFIYTRCPSQCPLLCSKLAGLQRSLPPSFRIVSFSVDTGHDTPEVLKSFADSFRAQPDRWVFLTGDLAVVEQVQKAWNFAVEGELDKHTLKLVLVDASGIVRGYFDGGDAADIARLNQEALKMVRATSRS